MVLTKRSALDMGASKNCAGPRTETTRDRARMGSCDNFGYRTKRHNGNRRKWGHYHPFVLTVTFVCQCRCCNFVSHFSLASF